MKRVNPQWERSICVRNDKSGIRREEKETMRAIMCFFVCFVLWQTWIGEMHRWFSSRTSLLVPGKVTHSGSTQWPNICPILQHIKYSYLIGAEPRTWPIQIRPSGAHQRGSLFHRAPLNFTVPLNKSEFSFSQIYVLKTQLCHVSATFLLLAFQTSRKFTWFPWWEGGNNNAARIFLLKG